MRPAFMYLFFGGLAFTLNLTLFAMMDYVFGLNELLNNIICWTICVLFQFFTNRTWVFDAHADSASGFIKQMAFFFGGRVVTLVLEELILGLFITWLQFHAMAVKLAAQAVVIILNYLISRLLVFRK